MLYLTHVPRPPLSEFMHFLWLYEGYTQAHAKERVLPSGEMQLVINLLEDKSCIYDRDNPDRCQTFRGSLLSGAHSEYQVISTAMQAFVIGVHFRPGGAFPFLRMPAGELRDTTVSLDTLWGVAAVDLRDRLLEAPTHQARFGILEQALLAEFARGFHHHQAVGFALRRFLAEPQVMHDRGRDGSNRPEPQAIHPGISRSNRIHAQGVLPHPPVSAGAGTHGRPEECRVGQRRAGLRLLRSGAFYPRFPRLLRHQSHRLSGAPDAASQPCAVSGVSGRTEGKFHNTGQIFTIRAAMFWYRMAAWQLK